MCTRESAALRRSWAATSAGIPSSGPYSSRSGRPRGLSRRVSLRARGRLRPAYLPLTRVRGRRVGRADIHLHSDLGDGLSSLAAILDAAERAGLDVIALTDHDDIRGAFALREVAARRAS